MSLKSLVKISAAGAGKTWDLCHAALSIKSKKNILMTTYTLNGVESLFCEVRKQNCGIVKPNIKIKTWHNFLLSELIKPYQNYLFKTCEINGYDFTKTYGYINYNSHQDKKRYINNKKNIFANEASHLVLLLDKLSDGKVFQRIRDIYDYIFIDEIQDMCGYDLDIIRKLLDNTNMIFAGDCKQATYATHNARKNKNISGQNIWIFFDELYKQGLIEIEKRLVSKRFNVSICNFANEIFPVDPKISTEMKEKTEHDGIFLIRKDDIDDYCKNFEPTILRWDKKTKYNKFCYNFGACKGLTFERILILPNNPLLDFIIKNKKLQSPEKYYVAVTRAKFSIAISINKICQIKGFSQTSIQLKDKEIWALKYIN